MSGWRQAVFIRQRRVDVIQRALASILDDESWSPATPRPLHIGAADASSRGWTMIVPALANFFLERGGLGELRLCRLARELRCPAYEVDVRDPVATALYEADDHGRLRVSGTPRPIDHEATAPASATVGFGLVEVPDDIRDRVAALTRTRSSELADYLGAIAGFPAWTRYADAPITADEVHYDPPRIVTTARIAALPETRAAIAHTARRAGPAPYDRRCRRPRSAARPRH